MIPEGFYGFILDDMFWIFSIILIASAFVFLVDGKDLNGMAGKLSVGIHILALVVLVIYLVTFVSVAWS